MTATSSWRPPAQRTASRRTATTAPRSPADRTGGSPAAARRVPHPAVRRLRRVLRRSRRPAAALLLAAATALVAHAVLSGRDGAAPGAVAVVVASRDLPAGAALAGGTTTAHLPAAAVPRGALDPTAVVAGARSATLAAPVRRGEVLTDVRLASTGLLASLSPGQVALAVPVASPLPPGLVGPGSRVTVLAAGLEQGLAETPDGGLSSQADPDGPVRATSSDRVLVQSAVVLAVDGGDASSGLLATSSGDAVVVLAVQEDQAARVAAAASSGGVVLAVTP